MKFFRDMCEEPMGVPSGQYPLGLNLTFRDFDVVAMQLPHMIHDGGPAPNLGEHSVWHAPQYPGTGVFTKAFSVRLLCHAR